MPTQPYTPTAQSLLTTWRAVDEMCHKNELQAIMFRTAACYAHAADCSDATQIALEGFRGRLAMHTNPQIRELENCAWEHIETALQFLSASC